MKKFVLILLLVLIVAITSGCCEITPTITSDELGQVQEAFEVVFDEYEMYIEADPDLDEDDKAIRLETPESIMELLEQLIENTKATEADGYITEE